MVKQKEENPQSYREGMERSLISVEIIAKRAGFCEMSTEKKKLEGVLALLYDN